MLDPCRTISSAARVAGLVLKVILRLPCELPSLLFLWLVPFNHAALFLPLGWHSHTLPKRMDGFLSAAIQPYLHSMAYPAMPFSLASLKAKAIAFSSEPYSCAVFNLSSWWPLPAAQEPSYTLYSA